MFGPDRWQALEALEARLLGSAALEVAQVPLRATVLLALAFGLVLLLRRRAASLRHRVWAVVLIALVLLPLPAVLPLVAGRAPLPALAMEVLPARPAPAPPPPARRWWQPVDPDQATSIRHLIRSWKRPAQAGEALRNHGLLPPETQAAAATDRTRGPLSPLALALVGLWLAGTIVVAARTLAARRRARQLLRLSRPVDPQLWPGTAGHDARDSDAIDLPITVGALRPVILLPRSGLGWPLAWRRSAVAHERAHLRQRDPLLQAIAELATALYWFHPLVWLAARQLRIERELAADDQVLLEGNRSSDYAELLVTLACAPDAPPVAGAVLPLLTPAGLKARLLGILDPRRSRLTRRTGAVLLALAGALALVPVALALPVRVHRPAPSALTGAVMSTDGFLIGRAVDGVTGQPLGGVEVDFLLAHRVLRAVTEADGAIRVPLPGPKPPQDAFSVYARRGPLAARKQIIAVKYGTQLPLDLALHPGHTVRGRLRSHDGKPVAGAQLHVIDWQAYAVGPGGGALATTGADGRFSVGGVMYGQYTLMAVAPDGLAASQRLQVEDGDPAPLDLRLPDTTQVSGWLRDEEGRPLAGVYIERPDSMEMYPRGRTGEQHVDWDVSAADGSFRMLPLGDSLFASTTNARGKRIEAIFDDGGVARRIVGIRVQDPRGTTATSPGIVVLQRPALLSVKVQAPDGTPVPNVSVQVAPPSGRPLWMFWGRRGVSGSHGHVAPMAVPPGSLKVTATIRGASRPTVQPLALAPGEGRVVTLTVK